MRSAMIVVLLRLRHVQHDMLLYVADTPPDIADDYDGLPLISLRLFFSSSLVAICYACSHFLRHFRC